ncbi:MAG: hypothetical protein ACRDZX_05575 [Acidimicrobiales bacterium]
MGIFHVLLASANGAPWDWLWGTLASIVFVVAIAIPAAILNVRERRRRQQELAAQGDQEEQPVQLHQGPAAPVH